MTSRLHSLILEIKHYLTSDPTDQLRLPFCYDENKKRRSCFAQWAFCPFWSLGSVCWTTGGKSSINWQEWWHLSRDLPRFSLKVGYVKSGCGEKTYAMKLNQPLLCLLCSHYHCSLSLKIFFYIQLYCPTAISSMGNSGCLPWGKPAATELRYPTHSTCWVF